MKNSFLKHCVFLIFILLWGSCKKEKEIIENDEIEPKPTAAFDYKIIDEKDPFTYQFENHSENSKDSRWSFGDDSTSSEFNPTHTFLYTEDFNVKLISFNEEGYWAQREETVKIKVEDLVTIKTQAGGEGELKVGFETDMDVGTIEWYDGYDSGSDLLSEDNIAILSFEPGEFKELLLRLTTPKGSVVDVKPLMAELGIVNDLTNIDNNFTISHENSGGEDANEGSKKMIDNNITTKVFIGGVGEDLSWQFEFYEPQIINAYSMTSGNDSPGRDPEDWVVEGSLDGEHWETIDQREGEEFEDRRLSRTFLFENKTEYKFYRFKITKLLSGSNFQLSELRMLQVPQ